LEAKKKIALSMLKYNADLDFIRKTTGLTKEEIKNLKNGKQVINHLKQKLL